MEETVSMIVYESKSVAQAILAAEMPDWKKWLLRKLLPDSFWDCAPQTLVDALPKGREVMIVDIRYRNVDPMKNYIEPTSISVGE